MIGSGKRVLAVGGDGVVLYNVGSAVEREVSLSWEIPQFEFQLTEALRSGKSSKPVVILFDGADQVYSLRKDIPGNLSTFDKKNFIKRKLDLAFPSYPVRAAMEVKFGKKKGFGLTLTKAPTGEPPVYLFAALSDTEQVDRIGSCLLESGAQVGGLGLLPMESTSLVEALSAALFADNPKKSHWKILIGQHETGGLRQIVVKDGNLALTRGGSSASKDSKEEAAAASVGHVWAENVMSELKSTLAYIPRSGYKPDDGLDIIVIAGNIEKQFIDPAGLQVNNFACLNVGEALRKIGIRPYGLEDDDSAMALHAGWLGKKGSLTLPVRVPSVHSILAPRLAARLAGGLIGLCLLGSIGINAWDFNVYRQVNNDVKSKELQKSASEREYQEAARVFDALPVKPSLVKASLAIKKKLEDSSVSVVPSLLKLKSVLSNEINLTKIDVVYDAAANMPIVGKANPAAAPKPATDGKPDHGKLHIKFSFTLPAALPLEQRTARANSLKDALKLAFTGWDVFIVKQFGSFSPEGKFEGAVSSKPVEKSQAVDDATFEMTGGPL